MTGPAITLMLVAIVIIWGGLAVTALVVRGRREDKEARAQALAVAREHLRHPEDSGQGH